MRTGSPRASHGYTYLGVLVLLVVLGAVLAAAGTAWGTAAQRDRERELRFRGTQISQAIGRYREAQTPAQWPPDLQALLQDRRSDPPRHHLRRLFADPFTGRPDWVLLPPPPAAPGATPPVGVAGVRSRADKPRMDTKDTPAPENQIARVSDWAFVHRPKPPAAVAPGRRAAKAQEEQR
jgi:type II secretory pathway pseudopilin PulG